MRLLIKGSVHPLPIVHELNEIDFLGPYREQFYTDTVGLCAYPLNKKGRLASVGDTPHMSQMTSTENPQTEVSCHAAAIERWEDEGGASKVVIKHDRRKTIKKPAPLADDQE
jgi:hypothetical protein